MKIVSNGEYMPVTSEGYITRECLDYKASEQWKLLGAVRHNNFGYQVDYVPFPACGAIREWQHKNGKQKWHIVDYDHGCRRMWGSPNHHIITN